MNGLTLSLFRYTLGGSPETLKNNPAQINNTLVFPMYDRESVDFRCGWNATGTGPYSDVATVIAGSTVGVRPSFYQVPVSVALFIRPVYGSCLPIEHVLGWTNSLP